MSLGLENDKRSLRAGLRERRRMMSTTERAAASEGIRTQLDALVTQFHAHTVSCFLSTNTEPGTRHFVNGAVGRGIRVLLPISRDDGLLDWAVAGGTASPVRSGLFGIDEPTGPRLGPDAIHQADLMIIPAAAVDTHGTRLGWGRGFFDRTLATLPSPIPVFAVIFDSELVSALPRDVHDQPISGAVTPTRTVKLALADQ